MGKRAWFNVPERDIVGRIKGEYDYGDGRVVTESPHLMKFWRDMPPTRSRATSSGSSPRTSAGASLPPETDIKALVAQVNREDLWREAAKELGVAAADIPASTSRGPETFFDGKVFDPDNPQTYLASLSINRVG